MLWFEFFVLRVPGGGARNDKDACAITSARLSRQRCQALKDRFSQRSSVSVYKLCMRKAHYWILANRRDPKTQISNDTSLPWPMTRRCSFIASGYAWNKRALGECKRLSTSAGSNCWRTVTEHDLTVIKKDAFVWVLTLCRVSLLPSWVIGDKLFSLFLYLYHKHEQLSKT